MKKILALTLALIMILGLATTAFATDITIADGNSYSRYGAIRGLSDHLSSQRLAKSERYLGFDLLCHFHSRLFFNLDHNLLYNQKKHRKAQRELDKKTTKRRKSMKAIDAQLQRSFKKEAPL